MEREDPAAAFQQMLGEDYAGITTRTGLFEVEVSASPCPFPCPYGHSHDWPEKVQTFPLPLEYQCSLCDELLTANDIDNHVCDNIRELMSSDE